MTEQKCDFKPGDVARLKGSNQHFAIAAVTAEGDRAGCYHALVSGAVVFGEYPTVILEKVQEPSTESMRQQMAAGALAAFTGGITPSDYGLRPKIKSFRNKDGSIGIKIGDENEGSKPTCAKGDNDGIIPLARRLTGKHTRRATSGAPPATIPVNPNKKTGEPPVAA